MKLGLLMTVAMATMMVGAAAQASTITSSDGMTLNAFPVVNSYNDVGPEVFGSGVTYTSDDPSALYGFNKGYQFGDNGISYDVLTATDGGLGPDAEINFLFAQPVSAAGFQTNWADSDGPVTLTAKSAFEKGIPWAAWV